MNVTRFFRRTTVRLKKLAVFICIDQPRCTIDYGLWTIDFFSYFRGV